jgi:hypothetical protein
MARELVWRRALVEYVDGTSSNGHILQGPFLAPGETMARLYVSWLANTDIPEFPAWATGFGLPFGVIVLPSSVTAGGVPGPQTSPNADWVWWEPGWFLPRAIMGFGDPSVVQEVDLSPPQVGQERDVKAQRKADPDEGSYVWFRSESSTEAPIQTRHTLSVAYSVGVLLPP